MKKVNRIFHAIGQGAFYTERHRNFNVVYDCGNWKNTKLSSRVVKNSFNSGDEIDILFISHFDYDHVSKINILKTEFKIKTVIMPLLHQDEKDFLVNIYNMYDEINIIALINDPEEYFGEKTQIIRVKSSEDNEKPIEGDSLNIDEIGQTNKEITSGTVLKLYSWMYIPFNYECKARKKELKLLFNKYKLDITKFTNDIDYAIENRKRIKEIYNKVSGGINKNSMIVYSGPEISNNNTYSEFFNSYYSQLFPRTYSYYPIRDHRIGCIYTGDANLNICKIESIYKKYWDNVGTIQIPHHGDLKSFNSGFLKDREYICPISVGVTNTYGHPSGQVISKIIENNSYPFMLTEKADSILVQRIHYL